MNYDAAGNLIAVEGNYNDEGMPESGWRYTFDGNNHRVGETAWEDRDGDGNWDESNSKFYFYTEWGHLFQ